MPKEHQKVRRPTGILSKSNLHHTWLASRDKGKNAGAAGSDRVSARSFAANLDHNLSRLAKEIATGKFGFSGLRARTIPKPNSDKDRLICVPTVQDRLVQRRMSQYLYETKKFQIYNNSSFGFIPEKGVKKALQKCLEYREKYGYAFETDIVSFFDQVDRKLLFQKAEKFLRGHSLLPLIAKAIRCEIRPQNKEQESKILQLDIRKGRGIRQGMPLSPMLANLALSEFDKKIEKLKIPMVRYADDIVVFAPTQDSANEFGLIVAESLDQIGHTIPDLEEGGKTQIVKKFDPLIFLGREIIFSNRDGRFVQRIPKKQIEKILEKIRKEAKIDALIKTEKNFSEFSRSILSSVSSYINSYRDAQNVQHFENEIRGTCKKCIEDIYVEIFGSDPIRNLSKKHREFLGLKSLDFSGVEADPLF